MAIAQRLPFQFELDLGGHSVDHGGERQSERARSIALHFQEKFQLGLARDLTAVAFQNRDREVGLRLMIQGEQPDADPLRKRRESGSQCRPTIALRLPIALLQIRGNPDFTRSRLVLSKPIQSRLEHRGQVGGGVRG